MRAAPAVLLALGLCIPALPAGAQPAARPLVLVLTGRTAGEWPVYIAGQVGFYAANGIKPDIVVAGSPAAGAEQLTAGSADVADLSSTQIVEAIMAGAPTTSVFDRSRTAPFPSWQKGVTPITDDGTRVFGLNVTWARSHSDLVVAFLHAYVQSVQWLYDPANKTRAIEILAKETNATLEDAERTYALYITKIRSYALNGAVSPDKVRLALDTLVKAKHINAAPPALGIFYDNHYVAQVNARLKIR